MRWYREGTNCFVAIPRLRLDKRDVGPRLISSKKDELIWHRRRTAFSYKLRGEVMKNQVGIGGTAKIRLIGLVLWCGRSGLQHLVWNDYRDK